MYVPHFLHFFTMVPGSKKPEETYTQTKHSSRWSKTGWIYFLDQQNLLEEKESHQIQTFSPPRRDTEHAYTPPAILVEKERRRHSVALLQGRIFPLEMGSKRQGNGEEGGEEEHEKEEETGGGGASSLHPAEAEGASGALGEEDARAWRRRRNKEDLMDTDRGRFCNSSASVVS
jgi:hypothetical protein